METTFVAGEYQGDSTELIYLRARYYSPADGRFQSRDTWAGYLDFSQSQNHFSYTSNNPIRYIDPTGHYGWENFKAEAIDLYNDPIGHTLREARKNQSMPFECTDIGQLAMQAAPVIAPLIIIVALPMILVSPDSAVDLAFMAYDHYTGNYAAFAQDAMGLMIPGVTGLGEASRATEALSRADEAYDSLRYTDNLVDGEIGIVVRKRGTFGEGDAGHFAVYTTIGDSTEVRGFWPLPDGLPQETDKLFDALFNGSHPGLVQDDIDMLDNIGSGFVQAQRTATIEETQTLRNLLGDPGPRDVFYSFNPDNFPNTYNCVTWGCSKVNQVFENSIPTIRQGRIKEALITIGNLPPPWKITRYP